MSTPGARLLVAGAFGVLLAFGADIRPVAGATHHHVSRHNGTYLKSAELVNFLWARNNWDSRNPGMTESDIDRATTDLVDGDFISGLRQYGVRTLTFDGSWQALHNRVNCPFRNPGSTVNTAEIVTYLACNWDNRSAGFPAPNGHRIYVLYVPQDTRIADLGGIDSCGDYDGYHFFLPDPEHPTTLGYYIVLPLSCVSDMSGLTSVLTHEVAEAMTDPVPGLGWYEGQAIHPSSFLTKGEVADICDADEVPYYTLDGLTVTSYWSNADNTCVAGGAAGLAVTGLSVGVSHGVESATATVENFGSSTYGPAKIGLIGTGASNAHGRIEAPSFPTVSAVSIPAGATFTYTESTRLAVGDYNFWMSVAKESRHSALGASTRPWIEIPGSGTDGGASCSPRFTPQKGKIMRCEQSNVQSELTWVLADDLLRNATARSPQSLAPDAQNPFVDDYGNAGTWTIMVASGVVRDPSTYSPMPDSDFTPDACGVTGYAAWDYIGAAAIDVTDHWIKAPSCAPGQVIPPHQALLHPGSSNLVMYAWRSPISGEVSITGGFASRDCGGGSPIAWWVDQAPPRATASRVRNLDRGVFPIHCSSAKMKAGLTATVQPGDMLYFIVDPHGGYFNDLTEVDASLTEIASCGPRPCAGH